MLNAILQLHKQGYQNLAILSGKSPCGMHWRCELHPYNNLAIEQGDVVVLGIDDGHMASHSSSDSGNEYFGWTDCKSATARELAEKITERFPRLLSDCRQDNHEYSGWLVSAVGRAESGNLPIMISDDGSQKDPVIPGSLAQNPPPLQQVLQVGGHRSVFTRPPHLTKQDDWHTAYIDIISSWRSSEIRRLPEYPNNPGDLLELGAYWEGAVWYIQEMLGFKRIEEFLDALRSPPPSSERWTTFLAVWNNAGQLDYLVAFLLRYLISGYSNQDFDRSRLVEYEKHLQSFEEDHREAISGSPNPYFGGSNPLHLGLILQNSSSPERLIQT